jgi:hypothetical protein
LRRPVSAKAAGKLNGSRSVKQRITSLYLLAKSVPDRRSRTIKKHRQ